VSARAGIVITGTEVLSGRVSDRNGPWLSERLRDEGIDLAEIVVVGDRPEDMLGALRFLAEQGVDLVVTSGGLGPTADDLTAEVVGGFCGRAMALDPRLEDRIAEILRPLLARWPNLDEDAIRESNRKQAVIPEGATVIDPVGTAPGLVVPPAEGSGPTVVVLPGPPRELQPMWATATGTDAFRAAVGEATEYRQGLLRLFGIPESEIAATLRVLEEQGIELGRLEITTCLRRAEIEIATRYEPAAEGVYREVVEGIRARHADTLFSDDGSTLDEQIAALLRGPPSRTVAVAESCTGGLVAARLTDPAGASDYFRGGVVAYSDEAKVELAGVDPELIERHGAVSPEVAAALADGAIERFGADLGIGVTGVAGPGGGSELKPVGHVCFWVSERGGERLERALQLPGGRSDIRDRSTTVALHMLRRVLLGADAARATPAGPGALGESEPSRT
jgi:competence/damage-inducible protein CinA-like protein